MEHTANLIFIQLATIIGLSALLGLVAYKFKLPLLVAYLLVGVLLSLFHLVDVHSGPTLTYFPEIGVAFVLFFIGMELEINELKKLGKPVVIAGLGQMLIATASGFTIASLLGFSQTESLFLGLGLSVSSTIVVIKMLLEKRDLNSLYGKLAIGILLLEDVISVLILMALTVGNSFLQTGLQSSAPLLAIAIKGIILFFATIFLSKYVLTRVFKTFAQSSELLFLCALSWCFIFVAISLLLGFSVVIGAFLAGVALANSPFHYEIQGKVKPLRDFFVTLFFVYLGSQVIFENMSVILPVVLIFSLFAVLIKPIVYMLILGAFGFRKHTLFQTSISLNQISEFSLIIMVVGLNLGLVSQTVLTAMALTGVVSIILSSVMITYSKRIYRHVQKFAGFFEHGKFTHEIEEHKATNTLEDHVIVIGAHRMGSRIIDFFKEEKVPLLVVDFNPAIIQDLADKKIHALYGDIGDPEILDFLNLKEAKMIISTATSLDDNQMLLSEVKARKINTVVITRAASSQEAQELYKAGASYVILPEMVAGDFILHTLKTHWPNLNFFKDREEIEMTKLNKGLVASN